MASERENLDEIARTIGSRIVEADSFQASFHVRRYVDQFLSGLYFLTNVVEDKKADHHENWVAVARSEDAFRKSLRRLCGLSRDLSLAMESDCSPRWLRDGVANSLKYIVNLVPETGDEELDGYLKNMAERDPQPV